MAATSAVIEGAMARAVSVEVHGGPGLPGLQLVGLARGAARESLVRVRAAVSRLGISLASQKLTVNLLPADLPKQSSAFDLPLAVALLVASGRLGPGALRGRLFYAELSLAGALQKIAGAVLAADLARRLGARELVVALGSAGTAAMVEGIDVIGAPDLAAVLAHLLGEQRLSAAVAKQVPQLASPLDGPCLSDVSGHALAKQALEVAAAGGHNLLLVGPPGSGKTLLASCIRRLLPPLTPAQWLEVLRVHVAANDGHVRSTDVPCGPPFRAPHHGASEVAMVGGGALIRPGEISLAHHGVLFLDELPEFARRALEALRQPLESGAIHLARAQSRAVLPARFLLLAAMNPCPCGHWSPPGAMASPASSPPCLCSFAALTRYRGQVSGPLLDRIDLRIRVTAPSAPAWRPGSREGPCSETVAQRVLAARQVQKQRFASGQLNAHMDAAALETQAPLSAEGVAFLQDALQRGTLSMRGVSRVRKVARTVADLAGRAQVDLDALTTALRLRGDDCW